MNFREFVCKEFGTAGERRNGREYLKRLMLEKKTEENP